MSLLLFVRVPLTLHKSCDHHVISCISHVTLHKSCDLQTCGLEILLARVGGVSVKEEGRSSEVTGDPRWNNFVGSLKERGYFQVSLVDL